MNRPASPPPYPGRFDHSRAEMIADGIVHAVGILIAVVAGAVLLAMMEFGGAPRGYVAALFHVVCLIAVLSISCAYNLWPLTPAKWLLRRLDHAAIYLLIAGTYTPFLAQLDEPVPMLAVVWSGAAIGMFVKLVLPGRFDRLAIVFYLAIGWSGVLVLDSLREVLSDRTLILVATGGIVYSLGVIFHVWKNLRFQTAVWHGFVVAGAGLHLAAVADSLVINSL